MASQNGHLNPIELMQRTEQGGKNRHGGCTTGTRRASTYSKCEFIYLGSWDEKAEWVKANNAMFVQSLKLTAARK